MFISCKVDEMTVAIMQPYIFPYLGYFQLVQAVDSFVFFDDVNYINKGWINRNNLLQQDKPLRFTVPLIKASQNKLINEIELSDHGKWKKDFLKTIEMNYRKAPHYQFMLQWLAHFFEEDFRLISDLASGSVTAVADLLEFKTKFAYTSSMEYKAGGQDGQAKVLEICSILGADTYINPQNGTELYESIAFEKKDMKLHFINMDSIIYPQFKQGSFVPNLSILDVLMFNGVEGTKDLLNKYSLN